MARETQVVGCLRWNQILEVVDIYIVLYVRHIKRESHLERLVGVWGVVGVVFSNLRRVSSEPTLGRRIHATYHRKLAQHFSLDKWSGGEKLRAVMSKVTATLRFEKAPRS